MSNSKVTKQDLFTEFPPVSHEQWAKIIERDLKGADYKNKLRWDTTEGIRPLPFYRYDDIKELNRKSPIQKQYADHESNSWEIREPIFADDVVSANQSARHALERGADALQVYLDIQQHKEKQDVNIKGIPIQSQQNFSDFLDGIPLEGTTLHFDTGMASPVLLAMLWNEVKNQNLDSENIWASFNYDPFVYMLEQGQHPKSIKALKSDIQNLASFSAEDLPGIRPLCINAQLYHNTGATIVQELAYSLAAASEYLSILTDGGLEVDQVSDSFHFSFAIGSRYFLEIAKFRAARLLWKNLLDAYGAEDNEAYLHGETSQWNKTLYDPYTNMLRTSTEGMSAAIGGCDSITIVPFDQHFRQPNEFSKRIARNQQIILSEESYLDKVSDPAAGSYYVEKLTEDLGNEAWKLFQEIENEGGLLKAIGNGSLQSAIKESQQKRDQAIATGERIFVGTNQYSNADDTIADQIGSSGQATALDKTKNSYNLELIHLVFDLASALDDNATIGDLVNYLFEEGTGEVKSIHPYRGTKAYEELRMATEQSDKTPKVLILPIGNTSWRKRRSAFTNNFFGCAGYNIIDPIGFENVDAATSGINKQQPDIAVICSSDKEYKELVPAIGKALKSLTNPPILVLAGYPKEDIETYKKAGVDEFIYKNCNILETLKRFQTKLNIIKN